MAPGPNKDVRGLRDDRWSLVRDGDKEFLYDLGPAPTLEEGEDLLAGPLSANDQAAWRRLSDALDAIEAELIYEAR